MLLVKVISCNVLEVSSYFAVTYNLVFIFLVKVTMIKESWRGRVGARNKSGGRETAAG